MVSLCALQIEIAEDSEPVSDIDFNCGRSIEDLLENLTMSTQLPKPVRSQSLRERARGNRKMSDVTIETYTDFDAGGAGPATSNSSKETSPSVENTSSSVTSSRRSTKDSTPLEGNADTINFVSGNPFVEVTKGILHLYKENSTTSLEDGVLRSHMICKCQTFVNKFSYRLYLKHVLSNEESSNVIVLMIYTHKLYHAVTSSNTSRLEAHASPAPC